MSLNVIEILGLIGGTSGVTAFIQWLITANSQRKKEGAFAQQEIEKVNHEKATSVDKASDIYTKLTAHVDEMLDEMREELKTVKDENKQLKETVKGLTRIVEDYKKKCDNCISKS
jgi:hypothetical protein